MAPSSPARPDAPSSPHVITVTDVGGPGEPSRTRPMTPEEHRDISEQIVLGLLDEGIDEGIDVSVWWADEAL